MIFEIEKNDLTNGLLFVQKAITGKSTIPILDGVCIESKDGQILLKGSDTITTIITTCKSNIIEEGSIVLDNKLLSDMKKFPDGKINFNKKDENSILVKSGRIKAKFPILGLKKDYPETKLIEKINTFKINSLILKNMIKGTIFAVAKDETRPILTGILFECINEKFSMVSLDGYRLSIQKSELKTDKDFELVIPSKALLELTKILGDEEEVTISYDNNNIKFEFSNVILQTRLLDGKYIKYNSLIPTDNDIILEIESSMLKETINRCSIVNKEQNLMKLNLTKDKLIVSSSNTTFGEIEEEIECKCNKNLEIAFNGLYLLDICNNFSGILEFTFKNSISPSLVKEKNGNGIGLVLPIRIIKK